VDDGTLDELRAWAAATEEPEGVAPRDRVSTRVQELIDADPDDLEAEREFIRWAERTADRGPTAEVRSTARVLLTLVRDRTPPQLLHEVDPPATLTISRRAAVIAGTVAVAIIVGGVAVARAMTEPTVDVVGPGPIVGAAQVDHLAFSEPAAAPLRHQHWTLDGTDVTRQVEREGSRFVFRPKRMTAGLHQLDVSQSGGVFGAKGHKQLVFQVDLTPPQVILPHAVVEAPWPADHVTIRGLVTEPSRVWIEGNPVHMSGTHFSLSLASPPATLSIVAIDAAGNRTVQYAPVNVEPRRPTEPVRGVHMTADSWANPQLRAGVLALIRAHKINTVELDVKDESGIVGFDPDIPFARKIGAAQPIYNLRAAVTELHRMGVRVIGRLVCFRDPIAAAAAWQEGKRDMVVEAPNGTPYSGYGGFLNVGSEAARRYNIAVAVAAARDGVDDILYDYVRRPDGPISTMRFPGMRGTPTQAVIEFLKESRAALKPYGTYLGASVFGIAASDPNEVAQNVPAMAREVDYIAPLIYPSHWGPGSYGVANPNAQPYDIIQRSLEDFRREVAGTGARLVPWLQDFSLGVPYGPAQVRAQIQAADKDGVHEFLLWDPDVTYTAAALTPNAPTSTKGLASAVGG
jgi:hypothetical protein